jgi:hypothetical protein
MTFKNETRIKNENGKQQTKLTMQQTKSNATAIA